jgi:ABC-type proline/glycine betaine transport system permease subunit
VELTCLSGQVFDWFTTRRTGPAPGHPELFWRQLELSVAVVAHGLVLGAVSGWSSATPAGAGWWRSTPPTLPGRADLALLTLLAIQPAISLKWNGFLASWLALTALAIPPILTNTYVGMREVDADVRDAAKAMGLTGGQVLRRVEAPLAVPFVMAGCAPPPSRWWPPPRWPPTSATPTSAPT